jgi:hypothetical protein
MPYVNLHEARRQDPAEWGPRPPSDEAEAVLWLLSDNCNHRTVTKQRARMLQSELRALVLRGRRAGIPVSTMTRAAAISRDTAHRFIREGA